MSATAGHAPAAGGPPPARPPARQPAPAPGAHTGPGTFDDGVDAFVAAARKLPAPAGAPDPKVAATFGLGWAIGEMRMWCSCRTCRHVGELPELDNDAARWGVLVDQVTARCQRLHGELAGAPQGLDLADQVAAAARLALTAQELTAADCTPAICGRATAVTGLHTQLLEVLWATQPALGRAYALGARLQDMCGRPTAASADVNQSLTAHATDIHASLLKLVSRLPANAAHGVDNSLRLWSASLAVGTAESATDLLAQGLRWREILAGDLAATDGLRLSDYLGAAGGMARQMRDLVRHSLRTFAVWLVVAAVLVGVGIWLLASDTSGTIGAGIVSVMTALGLTWKGIGGFLGRAAAGGEERLWNAELDWAIAYRLTVLRHPPTSWQLSRWSNALACDASTRLHLRRFKQWKRRWPDVDDWLPSTLK